MAKQYVPNLMNHPVVNHKNGDKKIFDPDNLEWTTHKGNTIHAIETGLTPKTLGSNRCMEELDQNGNVINSFESTIKTAEYIGCSTVTIRKYLAGNDIAIINNHIIRHKIYEDLEDEIWRFVNTIYNEINLKYLISNKGRVKNDRGDILHPTQKSDGYQRMHLCATINGENIIISEYVHRLVAFAFYEFTDRNHEVNHINKGSSNKIWKYCLNNFIQKKIMVNQY